MTRTGASITAVASLSGGQAARLGLAALIVGRQIVHLLDEPTNHLDRPASEQLEAALTPA